MRGGERLEQARWGEGVQQVRWLGQEQMDGVDQMHSWMLFARRASAVPGLAVQPRRSTSPKAYTLAALHHHPRAGTVAPLAPLAGEGGPEVEKRIVSFAASSAKMARCWHANGCAGPMWGFVNSTLGHVPRWLLRLRTQGGNQPHGSAADQGVVWSTMHQPDRWAQGASRVRLSCAQLAGQVVCCGAPPPTTCKLACVCWRAARLRA